MPIDSTFPCPVCGEEVKRGRRSCRACGASDSDGWDLQEGGEMADVSAEFDYEDYVEREFRVRDGAQPHGKRESMKLVIWLILAAMLMGALSPILF